MSAETKAELEQALAAHIMDETGDHLSAWVLVAECTDLTELQDHEASFFIEARDFQSRFLTDGLLMAATQWSEK